MNFKTLSILLCTALTVFEITGQTNRPVGAWKDYFPYREVLEVATGERSEGQSVAFARTELAVFEVESATNLVKRYSKVQGLSQSNPTAIGWHGGSEILLIGYSNGNIDLVTNAGTYNMPDIFTSNLIADKGVRGVYVFGDFAYFTCGFGVVVIDLLKFEVKDTWFITGQQDLREILDLHLNTDEWVVCTDAGIFSASTSHPFLSSAEAWTRWEDLPESPDSYVSSLAFFGNDILVHIGNGSQARLWKKDFSENWELFPEWLPDGEPLWGLDVFQDQTNSLQDTLLIGRCCGIERYDSNYNLISPINEIGDWMQVRDVAFDVSGAGVIWIASRIGGLLRNVEDGEGLSNEMFAPSGPPNSDVRKIDCWNHNLWFATGGVDGSWTNNYNSVGTHGFVDGKWLEVESLESENEILGIRDLMTVSIDPLNPGHIMFSSFEEGLIEVLDGEMVNIYNESNSTISEGNFGGSFRTGVVGVDYDYKGNLWITNPFTNNPLQLRTIDGTFVEMDLGNDLGPNDLVGEVMVTRDGYVWVILPRGGGLLVFDSNGTPSITTDDDWRFLNTDTDNGKLPSNYVYALEEDLDGEIWVGTGSGPAIFYRSESIFNTEMSSASQILIQQDGNYQYLLETETVNSIIIDGGNRKWLGTAGSGVYVLSDDGLTIEHHFSSENSPLPSNNITDIAINQANGEVFVATSRGTISYLGEATNWDSSMENMFVFPNPVGPNYDGNITIDGLDYESTVHITDAAGRLIATVPSMGGRAVWDGKLSDGNLAPYGVYLIFATDHEGKTSATTKLAITR
ncbi:MAG TPA: hypothetical protein EYN28_06255 [Flavobacteriales bacterium]|nr:hypothetical protein [Flavobacteriales bacterium]